MNEQQVAELAPQFKSLLKGFRPHFATVRGFEHLGTYSRGLLSDLARKSAEPIALAAGSAVRTLQEFLTFHAWDELGVRDRLQLHLVARDRPAPSMPLEALDGKPTARKYWLIVAQNVKTGEVKYFVSNVPPWPTAYHEKNFKQWRFFVRSARKDLTWGPQLSDERGE